MNHNRAASYTRVFPGDALTAGHQAESIRRFTDTLGMTIVREYEDEEYSQCPGRPAPVPADDGRGQVGTGALSAPSLPTTAGGSQGARHTWRSTPGSSGTPGSSLLCVRDKPPRSAAGGPGPGVPAEEGGLRARGNRRRLTLLQHMAANPAQLQG